MLGTILSESIRFHIVDEDVSIIDLGYKTCFVVHKMVLCRDYRSRMGYILFSTIQTSSMRCLVVFESIVFKVHYFCMFHIDGCRNTGGIIIGEIIVKYFYGCITNSVMTIFVFQK